MKAAAQSLTYPLARPEARAMPYYPQVSSRIVLNGGMGLFGGAALLFLVLPLVCLVSHLAPDVLAQSLVNPVVLSALRLSCSTSCFSTFIVAFCGGALAYLLARHDFPGKGVVDTLIDLPMVLPPMVTGLMLLLVFGRQGWIGGWLQWHGIAVTFTTAAVVIAQVFVSLPFFVRAARAAFESIDPRLETASLLLGASKLRTFFKVTIPVVSPMLLAGIVLAWARSLGEFGATIVFAGNFQGTTQTMPLAIFDALQSDLGVAVTLSIILLIVSFALVMTLKLLLGKSRALYA
jgi:molybdate transport system permease protein